MKTVMIMLIKNKLRELLKFFRLYGLMYVGIVFIIFLTINTFPEMIEIVRKNVFFLNLLIFCVLTLSYLLRNYPLLLIDPASTHFLYKTKSFKYILCAEFLYRSTGYVFFSVFITLVAYTPFNIVYFIQLTSFFIFMLLLNWKNYHGSLPRWITFPLCISIGLPLVFHLNALGIVLNILVISLLLFHKTSLDIPKYLKDMKFIFRANSALARNDHEMITAVSIENSVKDRYSITYPNRILLSPLIAKSIIVDSLRVPSIIIVMRCFVLILTLVIYSLDISTEITLSIAFASCLSFFLNSIARESVMNVVSMQAKRSMGLFLPYSKRKIAMDYALFPTTITAFVFAILIIFTTISALRLAVIFAFCFFVICLWHILSIEKPNAHKIISIISGVLISALVFMLVL